MNLVAGAILILAAVLCFVLTPPEAWFAGIVSGLLFGSGIALMFAKSA